MLVVYCRPTTRDEKRRLVDQLLPISGRSTRQGQWRHIELNIVVHADIRPWRYPPSFDFVYGDWLRGEFESGNVQPWSTITNPDFATLIATVLLGNTALLGPPPAGVSDPVPRDDLIGATAACLEPLLADLQDDTRNVILTLARMWYTVVTGTVSSKDGAADWALVRLPKQHREVLARARAVYLGHEEERWDDIEPQIKPCAEHLVGEIRRSVSSTR